MGTLHRVKGRKSWYMKYRDADGRWVHRVAFPTRQLSEQALHDAEVKERQKALGMIPRIDNRRLLAEVREAFEKDARARLRPRSLQRCLEGFDHVLKAMHGVKVVEEVTPERVGGYLAGRVQDVSTRTCNLELAGMKRVLNWAAEAGLIASNAIARVKPLPVKLVKVRRALAEEEVRRLLQVSPEPWRTIWWTFLATGFRHRELLELRWEDMDLAAGALHVRAEVDKSKRGREVTVPLSLVGRLRELRAESTSEYVFDNPEGLRRKNLLLREFYRCLKAAAITTDGSVDIHALRYTYVTGLIRSGANLKVVQALAGHSTLEMTLNIYAQVFPMDRREAVEKLPWSQSPGALYGAQKDAGSDEGCGRQDASSEVA